MTESITRQALKTGSTPLEFLLSIMNDDGQPIKDRIDAAKAAANFMHARKQETNLTGNMVINITPFEAGIS
jgi:hypothetical protein